MMLMNFSGFSQVIAPPFHGLYAENALGLAICNGTVPTIVVAITSTTGRTWMDRNLGAKRRATSVTDQESYGCLYQWGRGNDGHASMNWTSSTIGTPVNGSSNTLSNQNNPGGLFINAPIAPNDWRSPQRATLWQGTNGANNPCPTGYRLPTEAEMNAEFLAYGITNIEDSHTKGPSGGFKFTASGTRFSANGNRGQVGIAGYYWTSTVSSTASVSGQYTSSSMDHFSSARGSASSVRCIQ